MLDAGGVAPNVVQATAKVRYAIRARDLPGMQPLIARVKKVADGAALMTETSVEAKVISAVSNLLGNDAARKRPCRSVFDRLGAPDFDDRDKAFAARIQATLAAEDIASSYRRRHARAARHAAVHLGRPARAPTATPMIGSTDVGDVSWAVPTVQARVATHAIGTPGHSWQITAQGKMPAAHKGMVHAAKVMAATAVDALGDPRLIARAKADHARRLATSPYVCPIPTDVKPPVQPRPSA